MTSEIRTINHEIYNLELTLESIKNYGGSIYQFLQFVNIDDIVILIEKLYKRKPQFHANGMFKLAIAYHFCGKSYEKLLADISLFDIELLNFKNRELPSKGTLNTFIIHRIGEQMIEKIMKKLAWTLYCTSKISKQKLIGNEDSTPVEASRYGYYANYNPHYKCKMYKSHITMLETVPLYMSFTPGLTGDNPESLKNMEILNKIGITFDVMNKDGGYDCFENFAKTNILLKAKPNINTAKNAIFNKEGTIERIDNFINKKKYRDQGISVRDSIERKLFFFYSQDNKRKEQVGMYLRNQIIEYGLDYKAYPLRKHQERIHDHIKQTVKFNVRRVHNKQKKHHTLWSFISYQILCLTALQNKLNPNSFGFIY
jgi:hypothetical protein